MLLYKKTFYYLLLLLLGLIIAYWPVSFYVYSLKNDALNYFLPVRRLVSESYFNHIIPFWTPYLNLGYPLYGDMQSGVWNPIVQLLSLFGPYTLYTLHLETLLYIFLSGTGMFFLLKYFKVNPSANLMMSFAYMLCGFASDSAQFLNWIAALAFLPFVFLHYYRSLHERSAREAVYSATFLYLMFTTAYPADFIITSYLLISLGVWYFIAAVPHAEKKIALKKIALHHLLLAVVFLILSAPAILSFSETLPLTERGLGATYAQAMSNPLHPYLFSSWITPLAAWKMKSAAITDPLLRNSYFGIIPLIILIIALLSRTSSKIANFSKFALVFFALFSLGEFGVVRVIAYYTLPLMDTFRHPANARMFTIFFCCLLCALTFSKMLVQGAQQRKLRIALAILVSCCFAILLLALSEGAPPPIFDESIYQTSTIGSKVKGFLGGLSLLHVVIANMLIQAPFILLAWKWLADPNKIRKIVPFAILNSIFICILLQPQTVVKNEYASEVQSLINHHSVKGYPVPDLTASVGMNSADGMKFFKQLGVLNLYNKKVGRVNYRITPSNLLSQNRFWHDSILRNKIMDYPLIYLPDSAVVDGSSQPLSNEKRYAFVQNDSLAKLVNSLYPTNRKANIKISDFKPHRFAMSITSADSAFVVVLQNHFPSWKVRINDNVSAPWLVNTTFMGFIVPPGQNNVEIIFEATHIKIAFLISCLALIAIIIYRIRYIFP